MNRIRQALEKDIDISKYVNPEYVPQLIEIIYVVAVCGRNIERFVKRNNTLDIESVLNEYDLQRWIHGFEPLDDVIREAIIILGPYHVND